MSAPLAREFARRLGARAAVTVAVLGFAQGVLAGPSSAETVPYTDQSANGVLTFCDSNRQPITSGSIDAAPFVAFAIGSASAPQAYTGDGRTAALYAFQPVKGVDPTVWAGEGMTGYAKYTSPANPMAAGTRLDLKLSDFLRDAPPAWNNLVQIRMYVDAPDEGAYTNVYNAATVQVTGKTWKLISPTKTPCTTGNAVSNEESLPAFRSTPAAPATAASTSVAPGSGGATSSASPTVKSAGGAAANPSLTPVANRQPTSHGSSSAWVWIVVAIVLAAAVASALAWRFRRSRPST